MLCFAQHIRHTVCIDRFAMVECVMVFVGIGVCCCKDCCNHECVHLGLGFLQVVATVIVATLQRSSKSCVILISNIFCSRHYGTGAILHMACCMEPGITITAAVDAVELEGGILHHGVNLVGDNECARNIVTDLDTETRVGRDALRNVTDHELACLAGDVNLVAFLVVRGGVSARNNCPVRRNALTRRG